MLRPAAILVTAFAMLGLASGAYAGPVLDLTISLAPGPPPIFPNLTGNVQFYSLTLGVYADGKPTTILVPGSPPIDIGKLLPGKSFGTTFIPVDPCFAGGSCGFAFGFAGLSGENPAFAFDSVLNAPNAIPGSPPIIPIGFFDAASPGPPPIFGDLVGYDDPEVIGSWEAQISAVPDAVPEPGSGALFPAGLLLLMTCWRSVRRQQRAQAPVH